MLIARVLDYFIRIRGKRVVVICKKQVGFNGNIRLVGGELSRRGYDVGVYWECSDKKIEGLIDRNPDFKHIKFFNQFSFESLKFLLSAEVVLLSHSIRDGYISRRKKGRTIINLWHGVPIKGIELAMPNLSPERERLIRKNSKLYDYMIASSPVDRLAMSACFGLKPSQIWVTGLPRYDLLTGCAGNGAKDIEAQKEKIRAIKKGRRLVLYAPTFRESGTTPLEKIGMEGVEQIVEALQQENCVLGTRFHRYDSSLVDIDRVINLGAETFPETNAVLSETDILVTDFSSIWVDYLLLERPVIGFAEDTERYKEKERGFLYDLDSVFPGVFCTDLESLKSQLCFFLNKNKNKNKKNERKSILLEYGEIHSSTSLIVNKIEKDIVGE